MSEDLGIPLSACACPIVKSIFSGTREEGNAPGYLEQVNRLSSCHHPSGC